MLPYANQDGLKDLAVKKKKEKMANISEHFPSLTPSPFSHFNINCYQCGGCLCLSHAVWGLMAGCPHLPAMGSQVSIQGLVANSGRSWMFL